MKSFWKNNRRPLALLAVAAFGLIVLLIWPLPKSLKVELDRSPTRITDRNGLLLYEARKIDFGLQDHLPLEAIPSEAIDLLLAVEDNTFHSHHGVSIRGIARAIWQNHQAGKIVSGGSTITQQLVRNRLGNGMRRDYVYKAKEALLAIKLEARLSKDEILESYMNHVYFGGQAYGIGAASRMFFDKNVGELSLSELSFLVGLIQSPVSYDPFRHFDRAQKRHETVITIASESGRFTKDQIDQMSEGEIRLSSGRVEIEAPHFVMWVMSQLKGYEKMVRTSLDLSLQKEVELIVGNSLKKLADKNVTSAAVVVLDAMSGEVLAMVGSADYFDDNHDGAVNVALSKRQPGSTLKPFTYALAMRGGDTAASTVADIETQFFTQYGNPYTPRNYDYGYHGLVRYREALANSYNIAAVRVMEKVGVSSLLDFLRRTGVDSLRESPEHYGLGLTLGGGEVTLLELTGAYAMLARGGRTLSTTPFKMDGKADGERVLDDRIAWIITDILDDDRARLPEFGEAGPLEFPFPAAAKTGTTRNSRDNWTIGYTPDIAVGVWVGNADNTPMKSTSGITGAGPIFHEVMLAASRGRPPKPFEHPQGISQMSVCALSGKLPTKLCPGTLREWFIAGTEPRKEDDMSRLIRIDTRNGLLAGEDCSAQSTEEKAFTIFPPELRTWARENGWPQPPLEFSPLCPPSESEASGIEAGDSWILIEKPSEKESFLLDPLIPDTSEKVIFEASASDDIGEIEWRVNDQKVGIGLPPSYRLEWEPSTGHFKITATGGGQSVSREIEVLDEL